jgi:putative ABC transport system permease protein
MFKNYFKTACRTLFRNKLYTALNLAGLTFGISCFLLIGLYVFDELSFDTQYQNSERIYRVVEHKTVNGEATTIAAAGYQVAESARKKIPGIENATRIQRIGRANILTPENPGNFFQETVTVGDKNLLEVFDFPLVSGNRHTALTEPSTIILNESLARKLFNSTDILGKTVKFSFIDVPLKVTGVIKDAPLNTSFNYSSILSAAGMESDSGFRARTANDWLSENYSVYLLLKPNTNAAAVSAQVTQMVKDNFTPPAGTSFSFSLQGLKDMHLHSEGIVDGARNSNVDPIAQGNPLYISIFSFVAFFLLLIAGINYMNLTTAGASARLKEIGVRKTLGALKGNLIKQFLFETLLLTFTAFLLSIIVVNLLLPAFNRFAGKGLSLDLSTDYRIWLYAVVFVVITGLLAGSYPALQLSRFNPVMLLKGFKLKSGSDLSLRKALVVFQFTISVVMIIATIVLFLQVKYLNNTNLGFNKDLLVVIDVNTRKARSNFEAVKTEMAKIPTVKNVSVTSRVPGEWKTLRQLKIRKPGSTVDEKVAYMIGADKDFLTTYQVSLVSGRNFETRNDSSGILVNETAAKMLGIKEAGSQVVEIPSFSRNDDGNFTPLGQTPFTPRVLGIVKDFHFQSLRDRIEPLIVCYNNNPIQVIDYYSARIEPVNIQLTLEKLKGVMIRNDADDPFEYHFLDEQIGLFYLEDARRQSMLIWAALATIFIACLGLFGLATYSAEQRVKEIGVRKVLGASVLNLASLLSKDFLKLVLVANVIAFPIAWWSVNRWLQEYAYHIDLQWWMFIVAGLSACLIALLTVSYQAIKAAVANPVKSLRTE